VRANARCPKHSHWMTLIPFSEQTYATGCSPSTAPLSNALLFRSCSTVTSAQASICHATYTRTPQRRPPVLPAWWVCLNCRRSSCLESRASACVLPRGSAGYSIHYLPSPTPPTHSSRTHHAQPLTMPPRLRWRCCPHPHTCGPPIFTTPFSCIYTTPEQILFLRDSCLPLLHLHILVHGPVYAALPLYWPSLRSLMPRAAFPTSAPAPIHGCSFSGRRLLGPCGRVDYYWRTLPSSADGFLLLLPSCCCGSMRNGRTGLRGITGPDMDMPPASTATPGTTIHYRTAGSALPRFTRTVWTFSFATAWPGIRCAGRRPRFLGRVCALAAHHRLASPLLPHPSVAGRGLIGYHTLRAALAWSAGTLLRAGQVDRGMQTTLPSRCRPSLWCCTLLFLPASCALSLPICWATHLVTLAAHPACQSPSRGTHSARHHFFKPAAVPG